MQLFFRPYVGPLTLKSPNQYQECFHKNCPWWTTSLRACPDQEECQAKLARLLKSMLASSFVQIYIHYLCDVVRSLCRYRPIKIPRLVAPKMLWFIVGRNIGQCRRLGVRLALTFISHILLIQWISCIQGKSFANGPSISATRQQIYRMIYIPTAHCTLLYRPRYGQWACSIIWTIPWPSLHFSPRYLYYTRDIA